MFMGMVVGQERYLACNKSGKKRFLWWYCTAKESLLTIYRSSWFKCGLVSLSNYRSLFILLLCVLMAQARPVYPQDAWDEPEFSQGRAWDEPVPMTLGETMVAGLIASGYCLLSNAIVMSFNRFVINAPWAVPTAQDIRRNFTEPWKWEDRGGFKANHLGHPIQGMTYFSAGRVMGFGFYSSAFFSAFGSFTWEAFGESSQASINDFYITAPTGLSLGEIMFRLYMQAHAAGVPAFVTFIMNPTLGVHRLLTNWEPPTVERNLYDLQIYIAAAYTNIDYYASGPMLAVGGRQELFSHTGPFVDVGFRVIYGDPFVQGTWVPFRHFEFLASFGSDMHRHNDFRIFSNGYLFSFSPLHTETHALSTGLSLHFDFAAVGDFSMYYGIINMYSNALGWSVKYRHLFSPNFAWRARAHAAFTFFGASSYHNPEKSPDRDMLNYGYGINLKHLSSFEFGRRNRLDVHNFFYFQWSYPGTVTGVPFSQGFVRWQFHDFTFSHMVSQSISLGGTFSLATERGSFGEFPSTRKNHWSVRTFVAWNGRNIRGGR